MSNGRGYLIALECFFQMRAAHAPHGAWSWKQVIGAISVVGNT